jgi:hypothetical protein
MCKQQNTWFSENYIERFYLISNLYLFYFGWAKENYETPLACPISRPKISAVTFTEDTELRTTITAISLVLKHIKQHIHP